jgi:hypothetical protein
VFTRTERRTGGAEGQRSVPAAAGDCYALLQDPGRLCARREMQKRRGHGDLRRSSRDVQRDGDISEQSIGILHANTREIASRLQSALIDADHKLSGRGSARGLHGEPGGRCGIGLPGIHHDAERWIRSRAGPRDYGNRL